MFKALSPTYKGIILALIGYSGFAISDTPAKILTASYPTVQITCYIMLTAALMLLAFSPLLGGISRPGKGSVKFHILRGVMNFLVSILVVEAFAHLPLASVYPIIFAKPFIAALLAIPFYKEIVTRPRWIAIALGFTGVLIAMRPSAAGIDPALLLPLGSATCSAIMWITSRSLQGENTFSIGFYPVAVTFLCTLPFVAWEPGLTHSLPAMEHVPLFLICGAGVSTGVIGLSLAFRAAPSAAVSPFHYTQMIWGLGFGYFIFGDIPDGLTMLGAVIIISSGLFLIFAQRPRKKATPDPEVRA